MNETLMTIQKRYSCRSFTAEMPAEKQLQKITVAAVMSPSGMNKQPWRVILLKNRELMSEMEQEALRVLQSMDDATIYDRIQSRGGKLFYNAPCMVWVPKEEADPVNSALDCGIVAQTIALAATSLGLGSVICGLASLCLAAEKGEDFKKRLGFPEGYGFGSAVLLGYSAAPVPAHEPDYGKISIIE